MSALDKQQLADIVREVISGYAECSLRDFQSEPLPDVAEVVSIANELRQVLFPGYHGNQWLGSNNVDHHIGSMLDRLHCRLTEQIARGLRSQGSPMLSVLSGQVQEQLEASVRASLAAELFLKSLGEMRRLLLSDVKAAFEGDPAATSLDEIVFCYPGIEAITFHRMAHALYRLGVPLIPRMLSEWSHKQTGIDIHPGASIGPSFFIDHGTGVVIGETCEIGTGVTIYQSVTLGAWSFPRDDDGNLIRGEKRHPTIEDNVVIYSNATVLGGTTTIGRNSSIGAGVSLSRSVPANTIVTVERPQLRFREAA